MRRALTLNLSLIACFILSVPAFAETITFDEYDPFGSNWMGVENGYLAEEYAADMGVHFVQIDPADPDGTTYAGGTWSITGSNGANFYGLNGPSPNRGIIISFDNDVIDFSVDYRTDSGTMMRNVSYVFLDDSQEVHSGSLTSNLSWQTLSYDGNFDEIRIESIGLDPSARTKLALDNMNFEYTAVPAPGALILLVSGLAIIAGRRRKDS